VGDRCCQAQMLTAIADLAILDAARGS